MRGLKAKIVGGWRIIWAVFLADRVRWPLFLPIALAAGIGFYFALPSEPSETVAAVAGGAALIAGAAAALQSRLRMVLALMAALCLGFMAVKLRTEMVRAPVLVHKIGPVHLDARVVQAEPRGYGSRLVLEPVWTGRNAVRMPERIRVTVRAHSAVPEPGSFVHVLAVLMPPPAPSMPGDYDFGRWAYYQRIGAVGYLYGKPKPIPPLRAGSWSERLKSGLERLRGQMTARVRSVVPGVEGVISAALITGERADIDPDAVAAFRDSGLMHVLSISGLHLALAGGFFFWTIRALFALFPAIVLRYPVKKWAAVGALGGAAFYLLISGCEPPAVRSWIMLAIMFVAILFDRPALSMRSVAIAAGVILLAAPESILDAGFQMSFAAVTGLVALAEWTAAHRRDEDEGNTLWRKLRRYTLGIMVTSTIAGLATAPIAIFHFDRASPFGIIANLLALPVVSVIIMPAALAAMVLMPFGLDAWPLYAMGKGVGLMLAIAEWVASLPGAGTLVPAWPGWCTALVMGGGVWIALWRQRFRWLGLVPIGLGLWFALGATSPDILVARDIRTVGLRLSNGRLALTGNATDKYAAANWLRRAGDSRALDEAVGGPGLKCDAYGCLARINGYAVAADTRAEALAEDCAKADIVISEVRAHKLCRGPKLVIDYADVRRNGGYAVWLGGTIKVETVEALRGERPWTQRRPPGYAGQAQSQYRRIKPTSLP